MKDPTNDILKSLANKMYSIEMDDYKKGEGEKPKPLAKETKQTPEEKKKDKKVKRDEDIKKMVQSFFKKKSSIAEPVFVADFDLSKPKLMDTPKKPAKKVRKA